MGVLLNHMRRNHRISHQFAKQVFMANNTVRFSKMIHGVSVLPHREDRYGGIHLNLADSPLSQEKFGSALAESMLRWKQAGQTAVWIEVPIKYSNIIPALAEQGFVYHHAENNSAVLYQWIDAKNTSLVPRYATHQVGSSGCVVNEETKQVLVCRDRHRKTIKWKFPGGLSELGEDLGKTAEREVFEETGIKTKFEGVLTFRQQHDHPGAFGRSDFYFVCHMSPLTFDIHPDAREIEACRWIDIDDLVGDVETTAITLRVIQLVQKGLKEGFDKVTFQQDEFKSVFKGKTYKLFGIPVKKLTEYAYGLTDDNFLRSDPK